MFPAPRDPGPLSPRDKGLDPPAAAPGPVEPSGQAVLEAADEGVVVLDADARLVYANDAAAWLLPELRLGAPLSEFVDDFGVEALQDQLARRAAGHRDRHQVRAVGRDGEEVWLQVAARPLDGAVAPAGWSVVVLSDITTTKRQEIRNLELARTDSLTGVASRLTLDDRLTHVLARRHAGLVAVLFCDVDGLKAVNDQYGHAVGDRLLQHVCRCISEVLRPADTVARYGGDEFVIVCEDLAGVEEATRLVERIHAAVARGGEGVPLPHTGISIGVATAPPHRTPASLLAAADAAAYTAKRASRPVD